MDKPHIHLFISALLLVVGTYLAFILIAIPGMAPHLLLLIGASMMIIGGSKIHSTRKKAQWQQVTAVLNWVDEDSFGVIESPYQTSPRQYHYPVVEYEYEADGTRFQSTTVADSVKDIAVPVIDGWGSKTPESDKFWHSWAKGTSVSVYVNPKDVSDAVLVPMPSKKRRSHYVALVVSGALLLVCWGTLIWLG